jgi:hypothetical protein
MLLELDLQNKEEDSFNFSEYYQKISMELSEHNIKMSITSKEHIGIIYAYEYVMKNGISSLFDIAHTHSKESFIEIIDSNANNIKTDIFHNQFNSLGLEKELDSLILVDPYIFPQKYDDNYKQLLLSIIKYFDNINVMEIITQNNYNRILYSELSNEINNKNQINIKNTDMIHDRFWIFNKSKGIVVGTSLNGVGNKYTLINPLNDKDIKDILEMLKMI